MLNGRSGVALTVYVRGLRNHGLDFVLVLAVEAVKLGYLHHQPAADSL